VRIHFDKEIKDPRAYDLVINTEQVPLIEAAVRLRPEHAETHLQYALALAQIGREPEVRRQDAEGRRLRALGR